MDRLWRERVRGVRLPMDVNAIPRLVESQTDASHEYVCFDLQGLTSIRPGPLATLAAFASVITHADRQLRIVLPADPACCEYLEAVSGFCWFLADDPNIVFEGRKSSGVLDYKVRNSLLSMTRITTETEAEKLSNEILDGFQRIGGPTGELVHQISDGLQEPANNAVEHAESAIGAVCFAQARRTRRGRFAEIAVADAGIGIWASLRGRYPELTSHAKAIEKALEDGVTRFDDTYRGRGLWETHQLSNVGDRRMTIVSGDGCVVATRNGVGSHRLLNGSWPGTVVSLHFPLGR